MGIQGRRLTESEQRQIQRLTQVGWTRREVAEKLGIDKMTVQKYVVTLQMRTMTDVVTECIICGRQECEC